MKKSFWLLLILGLFLCVNSPLQAQSNEMSEELLKCLLSGICPEEKAEVRTAGVVIGLSGEVEYSTDNGLTYKPLSNGETIYTNYLISIGYESSVQIDFGFGELRIHEMTNFRIEKFNTSDELREVQMNLNMGAVRVIMPHTDAIRSDFSVRNTAGYASIRGSEMQVEITKNLEMLVHAFKDTAYVKGRNETKEVKVTEGNSIKVSADQKAGTPYVTILEEVTEIKDAVTGSVNENSTNKTGTTNSKSQAFPFWGFGVIAIAVLVGGAVVFMVIKRKKSYKEKVEKETIQKEKDILD